MKRLSTALTLMTALAAIAAASGQPEEHAQLASSSATLMQSLGDALVEAPFADSAERTATQH